MFTIYFPLLATMGLRFSLFCYRDIFTFFQDYSNQSSCHKWTWFWFLVVTVRNTSIVWQEWPLVHLINCIFRMKDIAECVSFGTLLSNSLYFLIGKVSVRFCFHRKHNSGRSDVWQLLIFTRIWGELKN